MLKTSSDSTLYWQEKLADQLRRGSVRDVRIELRQGLHHVVGCYDNSEGKPVWDSYAYYSKPDHAEQAVRRVKRIAALN